MPSSLIAVLYVGWFVATLVVVLVGAARLAGRLPVTGQGPLLVAASSALVFQVFHTGEHAVQALHWTVSDRAVPWLSTWAASISDGLTVLCGSAVCGPEWLHLIGNAMFWLGLWAVRLSSRAGWIAWGRAWAVAFGVQTAHVAEHVVLTTTAELGGRALGVTSLFGTLTAGSPSEVALRVWAHFGINAVATSAMLVAVVAEHRRRADATVIGTLRPPSVDRRWSPMPMA